MTTPNEEIDYIVKLSQVLEKNLTPELFAKSEKYRTLLRFSEARRQNPRATQSQICKSIGTSSSSIERIRTDLNISSPYRYSVSTKSDLQKEKEKYKRAVNELFKKGKISEDIKLDLYNKINSSFDKEVKDEVISICPMLNNRKRTISKITSYTSEPEPRKRIRGIVKGGTNAEDLLENDEPKVLTEDEVQKRIAGALNRDELVNSNSNTNASTSQLFNQEPGGTSKDKYLKMLNN
jgi:hypothetical protein